jgi:hypothetical protein
MSDVTMPQPPASALDQRAATRAARYAAYVFWLMFLINFLNYADRWVFSALSNVLKGAFHFNDFQIGILNGAFLLVYTLVALPMGYLADRVSRKAIVAAGVALWSIATALTAIAGSFASMMFVRALVGVGEGSYYPAGTPMLAAWYAPKKRASVLARWGVGALVGAGVGFLIAGFLAKLDWRLAFYFTGIPGIVLAFLIWRTREKLHHEEDPPNEETVTSEPLLRKLAEYLRIPTLRVILAVHALGFFALSALAAFLVIYLGATYGSAQTVNGSVSTPAPYPVGGLSEGMVAIIPGVILLVGGIGGNLAGSAWSNRLSRRTSGARVLAGGLGFLLAAPCVILTLTAPYVLRVIPAYADASPTTQVHLGVGLFIVFGMATAFFLNVYNGPTSAALQDVLPPKERSAGGGLELTLAHLLGDIYAASAVGALSVALSGALGGEQIGLALLLTCPVVLVASGIVGIWGARFYAKDVAALGSSADAMLGTHAGGAS